MLGAALIRLQIVWLNWGLTDEDMTTLPAAVQRGFMKNTLQATSDPRRPYIGLGSDLGEGKGRCLFAGTWNADIYPPLKAHVEPSDLHCAKNRMSGLWSPEQPLWKTLKAEKKNTILFTGVNTDQCVLGTFVDGYNTGWNCILVDDCCGTTTKGGKEVTFHNVAVSFVFLILVWWIYADRVRIRMGLSLIVRVCSPLRRGKLWNTRCLAMNNRVV